MTAMWRAVGVLVGMALIAFGASTLEEPWVTDTDQRSVAIVTLPCSTNLQKNSTGVVVDDQTVVTVAHAIFETRDFALLDAFGRWHHPQVIRLDLENDLAVLHVENLRAHPLPVAPAAPSDAWRDLPVRMLEGSTSGTIDGTVLRRVNIEIEVVGDRSTIASRLGYEVAATIGPGDSGAGLVDASGQFVGVVFARSTQREGITWATATSVIDRTPAPVPSWECEPGTGEPLELRPPAPRRLAG